MNYLFKRSDGALILGPTKTSIYSGSLWIIPKTGNLVDFRQQNGIAFEIDVDVTTIKKNYDGDYYTGISEFNSIAGGLLSNTMQLVDSNGNPSGNADYIDTTSATLIYEGYKTGSTYRICRIDISTPVISRTWATGAWASRTSLTYN
jgi:hypothetical protein